MTQRIGLFGGSFDPIHFGHLISAQCIAEQARLTRVILIPSARPPHKQGITLAEPHHRLAMARLAVKGDPMFEVSDVEIHRSGPSYTFDTVAQFREMLGPAADLFWIIGADSLPELPTWHRVAELVREVTILTACRPGFQAAALEELTAAVGADSAQKLLASTYPTPEIQLSASQIRDRVVAGQSIRYHTPDPVQSYIATQNLYRA